MKEGENAHTRDIEQIAEAVVAARARNMRWRTFVDKGTSL